nr:MAG: hypothetical protein DIU64_13755 [Caldicoprobacter oshimai]
MNRSKVRQRGTLRYVNTAKGTAYIREQPQRLLQWAIYQTQSECGSRAIEHPFGGYQKTRPGDQIRAESVTLRTNKNNDSSLSHNKVLTSKNSNASFTVEVMLAPYDVEGQGG